MSKASLELGGGNWAAKDGKLLGYAVGDTSGKYLPREFTFSRGADIAATRVKKGGLIEKYRENLFLQSNQFDTTWSNPAGTLTAAQAGYDGGSDAWLLSKTGANGLLKQDIDANGLQTYSIYAKAGSLSFLMLRYKNTSAQFDGTYFDLANGQVGTTEAAQIIESKITTVGGGWYRCSITFNQALETVYAYPSDSDGGISNAVTGDIYIQDAQLERGLVATDYLESDDETGKAGVLDNLPRIDYTSGSAQLLMEPSRTNLVSVSEGIPEATGAVTRTLNYGVAPDGTTSSLKVQKNGDSENDRIIIADDLAILNASTYTVSGFVKNIDIADTGVTTIAARVDTGTLFRQGYEWTGSSLATTSYSSNGSTSNTILEDYGNGWWRIGFTFTTDGTQLDFEIDVDRRNGSDTTSIETWGWQLEAFQVYDEFGVLISANGPFATSYIPTYGVPTTRAYDYFDDQSYNDVLGNGDISMLVDFDYPAPGRENSTTIVSLRSGSDILGIKGRSGANRSLQIYTAGNFSGNIDFNQTEQATRIKALIRTNGSTVELFFNGAKDTETITFPSGNLPYAWDKLIITGNASFLAKYNRVAIFTESLSDTECIALTTV